MIIIYVIKGDLLIVINNFKIINNRIILSFEELNILDKTNVVRKLIIRYDNKIYFNE